MSNNLFNFNSCTVYLYLVNDYIISGTRNCLLQSDLRALYAFVIISICLIEDSVLVTDLLIENYTQRYNNSAI